MHGVQGQILWLKATIAIYSSRLTLLSYLQGPGDSFQGRQGQLLWLKAMREAGVDARLCVVKDPEPPQENKKKRKRKAKEFIETPRTRGC